MVEQLTLNPLRIDGKSWLGAVLGAIDRQFWRLLAVLALVIAATLVAVATRYDVRRSGSLIWRVDRWTGTPEIWLGRHVGWVPK